MTIINYLEKSNENSFKDTLLCFDQTKDLVLKPDFLAFIKLGFLPCHKAKEKIFSRDPNGLLINEECIADEE